MNKSPTVFLSALVLAVLLVSCSHIKPSRETAQSESSGEIATLIRQVREKFAPDHHLAVFNVEFEERDDRVVLRGELQSEPARIELLTALRGRGFAVTDQIMMLPATELGDASWGIGSLSVASGRESPGHSAELGTQILMGHTVRVLRQSNSWFLVQSPDRYLSWLQRGAFVRCTKELLDTWENSPRLVVTAFEDRVFERPQPDAQPISDVVPGCLVKELGQEGDWYKVELPDQRTGYLQKSSATDYAEWKRMRHPTPDTVERTAKSLLGRPYLWGGNSPKGLDCSGFTKLVFFLNGVELDRNASHQAQQGTDVALDSELSRLKKGDLLFFGSRARAGLPERITHVGIYLGDKLFIHSSDMVRINSLDPSSPISDARRIRTLIRAKRVLPDS